MFRKRNKSEAEAVVTDEDQEAILRLRSLLSIKHSMEAAEQAGIALMLGYGLDEPVVKEGTEAIHAATGDITEYRDALIEGIESKERNP